MGARRHQAKPFLGLLLAVAFVGCSDDDPSGPGSFNETTQIAGRLNASAAVNGARTLGLSAALAGVTVEVRNESDAVVASTATDDSGEFATDPLSPGLYTVVFILDDDTEFSFSVEVFEGESLFVEGDVDLNPSGKLKIDAEIFVDNDGDGVPDTSRRIRITGRLENQPASGDVDVELSQDDEDDKTVICHVPPGNPDNAHTIVVGNPAVPAHLAHGDFEGECDGDDLEPDDDGDDGDGDDGGEAKVRLCHIPPGNPDNPKVIEVGESAEDAHLAHGDIALEDDQTCDDVLDDGEDGDGGT